MTSFFRWQYISNLFLPAMTMMMQNSFIYAEMQNNEHFYHRKMQNMTIWEIVSCRMCRTCNYWQMQKSLNRLTKTQIKWNLLKKNNAESGIKKGLGAQNLQNFNSFGPESTNTPWILQDSQNFISDHAENCRNSVFCRIW